MRRCCLWMFVALLLGACGEAAPELSSAPLPSATPALASVTPQPALPPLTSTPPPSPTEISTARPTPSETPSPEPTATETSPLPTLTATFSPSPTATQMSLPPTPTMTMTFPSPTVTKEATSVQAGSAGGSLRLGEVFYDGDVKKIESDEWVEVVNVGDAPLDVSGWRLQDDDDNVFWFPSLVMAPKQSCRVYTNRALAQEKAPQNYIEDVCGFDWHSEKAIWGNSGDVLELIGPAGKVVECRCWRKGCKTERGKLCEKL